MFPGRKRFKVSKMSIEKRQFSDTKCKILEIRTSRVSPEMGGIPGSANKTDPGIREGKVISFKKLIRLLS